MRKLIFLLLIAASAFGQAVSNPANPSSNPNQISVTNSYLYLNKMHYAGTWSGSATYNSQDVVVYSGAGYISLQAANRNNLPSGLGAWWVVIPGSAGGGVWGSIIGTLASQTDLQTALNARLSAASNLSDLASAVTARANLGLGTAAVQASSAFDAAGAATAAQAAAIAAIFSCAGVSAATMMRSTRLFSRTTRLRAGSRH